MTGKYYSYLSPKLEAAPYREKGGCGVFARAPVMKGELLTVWAGRVISADELDYDMPNFTQRVIQVEEGLYLLTPQVVEPADCFNHSCEPNAGMSGQIALVAMRDIAPGEEVCLDYAMCDGSPYDEFDCACGAPNCRKRVTGEDWKRAELQARYAGYFSPYLQRRIDALNSAKRG